MIEETKSCPKCGREIPITRLRHHIKNCLGKHEDLEIYEEKMSEGLGLSRQNSAFSNSQELNRANSINVNEPWEAHDPIIIEKSNVYANLGSHSNISESNEQNLGKRDSPNLYGENKEAPQEEKKNAELSYPSFNRNFARESLVPDSQNQPGDIGGIQDSSYPSFDRSNARENPNEVTPNNQSNYPSFNPNHARQRLNPAMNRKHSPSNAQSEHQYSSNNNRNTNRHNPNQGRNYTNNRQQSNGRGGILDNMMGAIGGMVSNLGAGLQNIGSNLQSGQRDNRPLQEHNFSTRPGQQGYNFNQRANQQNRNQNAMMRRNNYAPDVSTTRFRTQDGTLIERTMRQTPSGIQVGERIIPEPNTNYRVNAQGRVNSNFPNIPGLPAREQGMLDQAFSNHSGYQRNGGRSQSGPYMNDPLSSIFNTIFGNGGMMQDQFGSFFMAGQNPLDPIMRNTSFNSRYRDPFDSNLMDFVNMMRGNRARVFNRDWINHLINIVPMEQRQHQGMTKNSLNNIKKIKFKRDHTLKEEEEEKCAVCLVEFEDQEELKQLPCGHLFHPGCIDTWLVRNSKCPICKRDVKEGLTGNSGSSNTNNNSTNSSNRANYNQNQQQPHFSGVHFISRPPQGQQSQQYSSRSQQNRNPNYGGFNPFGGTTFF